MPGLTEELQGKVVYHSKICGPCVKDKKTCSGLDGLSCGQCMHDRKTCRDVVVESKCFALILPTLVTI